MLVLAYAATFIAYNIARALGLDNRRLRMCQCLRPPIAEIQKNRTIPDFAFRTLGLF
jgi:hypothetical protein